MRCPVLALIQALRTHATMAGMMRARPRRSRATWLVITVAIALAGAAGCGDDDVATSASPTNRQAMVAERSADVMPFDLDRTTHVFDPSDDGLVQTVVSDPPVDGEQVSLIRSHLTEEADRFEKGDFDDPASIHGHDMPGLSELQAHHDEIQIVYENVTDGARITYTTHDPVLVEALHAWADAQVHDHGDHAEGHPG
jgi:hypothetical protein